MIGIIDYGMGNIHSVRKALEFMGGSSSVVSEPGQLASCGKLVLPGVGAFGDAMRELDRTGMSGAIREFCASGKPFLGICLGMHLLFEGSSETEGARGLCLFKGTVRRFPERPGLKVPQMGWNTLRRENDCPLLRDIPGDTVYFCHSYYPEPREEGIAAATTEYGVRFPSVVWKRNVYACQFHPEKSQTVGLAMLKNFIGL